jgi:hypothetical protein
VPIPPEVQAVLKLNGTMPAHEFKAMLEGVRITAAMMSESAMPGAQMADIAWGPEGLAVGSALLTPQVADAFDNLSNSSSGSNRTNSQVTFSSSAAGAASPSGTVSAAFLGGGGWGGGIDPWTGWGWCGGSCGNGFGGYYKWWKEHYFLRNLYMNLRIPPKTNPCKYYKVRSAEHFCDAAVLAIGGVRYLLLLGIGRLL